MNIPSLSVLIPRIPKESRLELIKRYVLPKLGSSIQIIDYAELSTELYCLLKQDTAFESNFCIMICYIKKQTINFEKCWELNTYSESHVPPYINCPDRFLKQTVTQDPLALKWRSMVIDKKNNETLKRKSRLTIDRLIEEYQVQVGDELIHPSYGKLIIKDCNLKYKFLLCLSDNHKGIRRYKLPLMNQEHWELNLSIKNAKKLNQT